MSNRASETQLSPFVPALVLIGCFVVVLALLMPQPPPQTAALPTSMPTTVALQPTALPPTNAPAAQAVAYDPAAVSEGQGIFQSICSACHGFDARGLPGLGKNLIESQFVHGLTDDQLLAFIIHGRDTSDPMNTTYVAMPPRGGNPSLTDDQLRSVIAYLRTQTLNAAGGQSAPTAAPIPVVATASSAPLAAAILPTRIPVTPQPFSAETVYLWSCAGCHGVDGKGNAPFADGFATSPLLTDRAALLAFLSEGRPLADPRVEFPHPARGGYPVLTDPQLSALTDYVLTIVGSGAKP